MSSLYVRHMAEQWANTIGGVPFYPTINELQEPTVDMWLTLDFISYGYTKETYCGEFVEDGEIRLIFLGRVGVGYDALIQAAESFAANFELKTDPTGKLILLQTNPPADYSGQNDQWFIVEVAVDYQLRN